MIIDNFDLAELFFREPPVYRVDTAGFDVWLEWWGDEDGSSYYLNIEHVGKQNFRIIATDHPECYEDETISVDEMLDIILWEQ